MGVCSGKGGKEGNLIMTKPVSLECWMVGSVRFLPSQPDDIRGLLGLTKVNLLTKERCIKT